MMGDEEENALDPAVTKVKANAPLVEILE